MRDGELKAYLTVQDDASALDIPTMRRWNLILRVFMCEYLNLRPEGSQAAPRREELEHDELVSPSLGESWHN